MPAVNRKDLRYYITHKNNSFPVTRHKNFPLTQGMHYGLLGETLLLEYHSLPHLTSWGPRYVFT